MLKQASDGISKVWKVHKSSDPFYSGGKVEVSVDETKILCMHDENVSIIRLTEDGLVTPLFKNDETESEPLSCFCFHPSKEEIVVASQKSSVSHWSTTGEGCFRTFKAHQMPILAMAYDPTGTLVATGSADRTIRVWDVAGGFCTHSFKDHTDIIRTLQFHPNPTRLQVISTSDDNTIRIFDLRDQKCVAVFRTHVSLPTAISISYDGYLMASCGRDKVVNFYDLRDNKHIKTVPVMEELEGLILLNEAHSAQLLDGTADNTKVLGTRTHVLVTAGEQGVLKFFKVSMAGKDAETFVITPLLHFALSSAQRSGLHDAASSSSSSSGARNADAATLQGVSSLHYMPKTGEVMSVTKDYNLCSYSIASFVEQLVAQRAAGSAVMPRIEPSKLLIGSQGEILDMALIPSSSSSNSGNANAFKLALITNSTQVRIINEQFSCSVLEGHKDIVLCVDVSPDGAYIATSSKDHRVIVWSVADLSAVAMGEGHTDAVGSVSVSRSKASYASRNAFMASGGADKILKRWALPVHTFPLSANGVASRDLAKLVATHSVRAHDKDINSVAVSPNDSIIASASQDKTVRLWRSSDLTPIATLNGHKRGVWKVAFSPVDKTLVSCSGDRTLKMWSVVDHSLLRTFEGHTASVLAVKFVNKGTQLVSASADGLIRVWTIRSGECESTLDVHTDRVWALECLQTTGDEEEETEQEDMDGESKAAAPTENLFFFSGGSDSKLIQWKDNTAEEEVSRMELAERNLVLEQQMQNDLRNHRYDKALVTALDLGHSLKVLNILTAILEQESKQPRDNAESKEDLFSLDWSQRLDPYVKAFTDEQLDKVVTYLKDWNSNARHCYTSQVLLNALLRVVRVEALMKHRVILEALPALLSYTERHYQRLDRLNQASYMLEYFASMISLLPEETAETSVRSGSQKTLALTEAAEELPVLFRASDSADADEDSEDEVVAVEEVPVVVSESARKKKARKSSESDLTDDVKETKSAKKRKSKAE